MPAEHVSVQPGGLRREHIVAAAMVAAVTVVLGFASGFGVRNADAAAGPPANPSGPVAAQPGAQPGARPPAGRPAAGGVRPGGSQVGLRPGTSVVSGAASHAGADSGADLGGANLGSGSSPGDFPIFPPQAGGEPSAPPAGPGPSAPQCPPGILDSLLALLTQVLDGAAPAQAMSDAGIMVLAPAGAGPAEFGPTGSGTTQSRTGAMAPNGVVDLPVLLPVGEQSVPVVGVLPLLDTVARWKAAQQQVTQQAGPPAGALAPAVPQSPAAPVAGHPAAPAPGDQPAGDQLSQLAALLAPVGLYADPGTGIVDPLLAPVLGSLGCGGIVPAAAPEPAIAPGAVR